MRATELEAARRAMAARLEALDLADACGSHAMLSAVAGAVLDAGGGWTHEACEALRAKLLMLLTPAQADLAPITGELRAAMAAGEPDARLLELCDAVDVVHAALEAELASARAACDELSLRGERRWRMAEFATMWATIVNDADGRARRALLDQYEPLMGGDA